MGSQIASNTIAGANIDTSTTIIAAGFSGPLTGNVTGSASDNVLKAGDTMSGALVLPAGSSGIPSLLFTGSSNTGLSAFTSNQLDLSANSTRAMSITPSAVTSVANLVLSKLLCNNAVQIANSPAPVNISSNTSILILNAAPDVTYTVLNVVFPIAPVEGQIVTILLGISGNTSIPVAFTTAQAGASIVNGPNWLGGKVLTSDSVALANLPTAVSFYYSTSSGTPKWYRAS